MPAIDLRTRGGAVGPTGATGPAGGTTGSTGPTGPSGSNNVAAATGNATTDTANVLAAIAATPDGTWLQFGPGDYHINQQLTYHPHTRWVGAANGGTTLTLTGDLYVSGDTPAQFIVPGTGSFSSTAYWRMEHIRIQGPGTYSLGNATCRTSGVVINSKAQVEDCTATGFFAGFVFDGDHSALMRCSSTANYYGVEFLNTGSAIGSVRFDSIDLTGSHLASVHIDGASSIDSTTWTTVHLGFSPVCVFKTDSQDGWDGSDNPTYGGTANTQGGISNSEFIDIAFEAIGNCAILDISTGGNDNTVATTRWGMGGGFSWDTATYKTTTAPLNVAAYQNAWAVYARNMNQGTVFYENGEFKSGTVGGVYLANSGAGPRFVISGVGSRPAANFLGSGASWSAAFTGAMCLQMLDVASECFVYAATGTIAVGDLVEITGSSNWGVKRATGTVPIYGVAVTGAAVGQPVAIQVSGVAHVNCIGSTQILGGAVVSANTATPYLADNAASNHSMPVLGVATQNGAAPTLTLGGIRLTGTSGSGGGAGATGSTGATGPAGSATGPTGPGGFPSSFTTKTANYTAASGEFVEADTTAGGFTVTLPTGPAVGAQVAVKNTGSAGNLMTVVASGGGLIDGSTSALATVQYAGAIFEHKASNAWRISSVMTVAPAGPAGAAGANGTNGVDGATGSSVTGATGATGVTGGGGFAPNIVTASTGALGIPATATHAQITAVGGGGGGGSAGSASSAINQGAGGGGGAGVAVTQMVALGSNTTLNVTIGAGGTGGAGSIASGGTGTFGSNGGTTSVVATGIGVTALGGSAGNGSGANTATHAVPGGYGLLGASVRYNPASALAVGGGGNGGASGGPVLGPSGGGGAGGAASTTGAGGAAGTAATRFTGGVVGSAGGSGSTNGAMGASPAANTGAGGNGGGGGAWNGGTGPGVGGTGGTGGSGYVVIEWYL